MTLHSGTKTDSSWPKFNCYWSGVNIWVWGFSRALISNLILFFENSRWRIQYGGQIFKNWFWRRQNMAPGVFEVTDFESKNIFLKFHMADIIRRKYFQKSAIKMQKSGNMRFYALWQGNFSFFGAGRVEGSSRKRTDTIGFTYSKSRLWSKKFSYVPSQFF